MLSDKGEYADALRASEDATTLDPELIVAYAARARALRGLGRNQDALSALDEVLARAPDHALALDARAVLLSEFGRIAEARVAFLAAIRAAPRLARAHFGLAMLGPVSEAARTAMETIAATPEGLDVHERLFLLYALVKAYDDASDPARAIAAAEAGARLRNSGRIGDPAAELLRLAEAGPEKRRSGQGHASAAPIFVFGMARSGTTLVEQILSRHPDVYALGETEWIAAEAASAEGVTLAGAYLARWPAEARTALRVVDKSLGAILQIGAIRRAFPNARLVHVRRDPLDLCLSCHFTYFGAETPFAADLPSIGRYYRAYAELMLRWRSALPTDIWREVQYERLVADPEPEIRALLEFCGLSWNARCLDFSRSGRPVATASLAQVREAIYNRSVGRWRRYADHLAPLRAALAGEL